MEVEKMKISYTILPHFDKVNAEIFRISDVVDRELHIHLISKEFGSIFRKPIKKDYDDAKKWIDLQIKCMKDNNVNLLFIDSSTKCCKEVPKDSYYPGMTCSVCKQPFRIENKCNIT